LYPPTQTNMKKILMLLFTAPLFVNCSSTDVLTNNEIESALRKSFQVKSDSIAMAVRTNDNSAYYVLGSEDFYAHLSKKTKPLKDIYWSPKIQSEVVVMDEFHVTQDGIKNHEMHSDKNGYTLHFANTQKESYVSILKVHANEQQHYLLAVVYGLTGKKWKVDKVVPVRYSFFGYSADDMYELAKEKEAKGFTVDAFVFANGALNLIINGGKDFVFDGESEKKDYRNKLFKQLESRHGKFPVNIQDTNPASQLLAFDMAYYKKGLYTAVHYGSWIPMDNVPDLTTEYVNVKVYIQDNFPDLDRSQPYIFYRAFAQVPGSNGRYGMYGFLDENGKAKSRKR